MQTFNSYDRFTQSCIKQSIKAAIALLNADNATIYDLNHFAQVQLMQIYGMRFGEDMLSCEITAAVTEYIAAHVKLTFVE
jgi:hypothetical protein